MIPKHKKKSGYAMLELLFYIAFFAVLTVVVLNAMISMTSSFREASVYKDLVRSGNVMERMSREIRRAESIGLLGPGLLRLNTTNSEGQAITLQFSLSGDDVLFYENDTLVGNLNAPGVSVSGLSFSEIATAESKGVRIVLTALSENDQYARSVDFYDTIGLRGSY